MPFVEHHCSIVLFIFFLAFGTPNEAKMLVFGMPNANFFLAFGTPNANARTIPKKLCI